MADEPTQCHRRPAAREPHLPAAAGLQGGVAGRRHLPVRRGRDRLPGLLGPPGRRARGLVGGVAHHLRVGPALRQVVRRRAAQRGRQLPRPPRGGGPGRQGGLLLGGRAGRHPGHHLRRAAGRGAALRQRPEGPGGRAGRPGQHLPADDPRGRRRHAGLRPHRRAAQRRLRRLLVGGPRRPHQRRGGQGPHHRRRRLPPRRGLPAQAPGRRRRREHAQHHQRHRRAPGREPGGHGGGPGPLVPRAHGRRRGRVPGRAHGRRAAALPPLHLGHDRQAQGHHAHHRRLPDAGGLHPQVRVRPPRGHRRVLVHRRHRLGDRPQLHRLRTAGQRRDQRDLRRGARTTPATTACGRSSRSTRSRSSTRRPPPSGPS